MQNQNSLFAIMKRVIWKFFFVFDSTKNLSNNYSEKELKKILKDLRLDLAKKNDLKAFMVFSDKSLRGLIKNKPRTKLELLRVRGFSQQKVDKYGNSILSVIAK